jgi:hypothetical protein
MTFLHPPRVGRSALPDYVIVNRRRLLIQPAIIQPATDSGKNDGPLAEKRVDNRFYLRGNFRAIPRSLLARLPFRPGTAPLRAVRRFA